MKRALLIIFILLFAQCKNAPESVQFKKKIKIDSVAKTELSETKLDSVKKSSKPFKLNNILCYWENYIVNSEEMHLNLKEYKTKKKILKMTLLDVDLEASGINAAFTSDELFNEMNDIFFKDLNFDGFKDFSFYSKGSTAMTSLTNIYLFNNETKSFENSQYLSAVTIDEIDKENRRLITSNFEKDFEETKTHYFDELGKLKYTELVKEYFEPHNYKIYEKIIDQKVVKRDSVFISNE